MIKLQLFNLLTILNIFKIPKSLEEIQTVHWVFLAVVALLVIFIMARFFQKAINFLIKILIMTIIVLLIYLAMKG